MANNVNNPTKVITGPGNQVELLQRMGAEGDQRRRAEVFRFAHHPQVG